MAVSSHCCKTSIIRHMPRMNSPSVQSNMQFFADLSAKMIIVQILKNNNQKRINEVCASSKSAHDLLQNKHFYENVFLQNKQVDLFQSQVSHTAFAMVLNLLSLHPSHRRAEMISRRRDTTMARLSSSLGAFRRNIYNTPPKT